MVEEGLTTCKPKGLPPALHIRLKLDEARTRATRKVAGKVAGGWGAPAEARDCPELAGFLGLRMPGLG